MKWMKLFWPFIGFLVLFAAVFWLCAGYTILLFFLVPIVLAALCAWQYVRNEEQSEQLAQLQAQVENLSGVKKQLDRMEETLNDVLAQSYAANRESGKK